MTHNDPSMTSASASPAPLGGTDEFALPPGEITEPLIYLSVQQQRVVETRFPSLGGYTLPCWVPQRLIAHDMGFGQEGIKRAMEATGGKPYLWCTELENVHSLWRYDEPVLVIDGATHRDSEAFYHAQKPRPFDAAAWDSRRDDVMMRGLRAKLAADPKLTALLRATQGFPLLALKPDRYWGFDPRSGGENVLARMWERLRDEDLGS